MRNEWFIVLCFTRIFTQHLVSRFFILYFYFLRKIETESFQILFSITTYFKQYYLQTCCAMCNAEYHTVESLFFSFLMYTYIPSFFSLSAVVVFNFLRYLSRNPGRLIIFTLINSELPFSLCFNPHFQLRYFILRVCNTLIPLCTPPISFFLFPLFVSTWSLRLEITLYRV